ncbi:MAG: nucleotide-binding protein [Verrucomicrobia bacterium]|nr:nucleotide-binding protein [Verrucomicrobiota bacterium]
MKQLLLTVCLVLAAQLVCAQQKAPSGAKPQPSAINSGVSGKVTEVLNAASYTYVKLNTGKKEVWVAAVKFDVKNGDSVSVADPMPMPNYESKTLKRTFDLVYFAADVTVNGKSPKPELPEGHPPISGAEAAPKKVDLSGIKKAAGGKTVEEIHLGKAKIRNQPIVVRGKVVKYSAAIMGKNWLHIQDGTGRAGNDDLVITTDATAKVGDTVLVTGKVTTDKDFGAGYKYGVIIENAKVVVE